MPKRHFTFRAKSVFIAFAILAVAMSFAAKWQASSRAQRQFVAFCTQNGGHPVYEFQEPLAESPPAGWLCKLFGVDAIHRVVSLGNVGLASEDAIDKFLYHRKSVSATCCACIPDAIDESVVSKLEGVDGVTVMHGDRFVIADGKKVHDGWPGARMNRTSADRHITK